MSKAAATCALHNIGLARLAHVLSKGLSGSAATTNLQQIKAAFKMHSRRSGVKRGRLFILQIRERWGGNEAFRLFLLGERKERRLRLLWRYYIHTMVHGQSWKG